MKRTSNNIGDSDTSSFTVQQTPGPGLGPASAVSAPVGKNIQTNMTLSADADSRQTNCEKKMTICER